MRIRVCPCLATLTVREVAICAASSDVQDQEELLVEGSVEISLVDLALIVVPRVRSALVELRSDELLKEFFKYDEDGSGKLSKKRNEGTCTRYGAGHTHARTATRG